MHLCLNKVFLNVSHSVTNENSEQQLSKRWTPTAEALLAVIVHVFYATVYYYIHVCSIGFYRKSGKLKIEYDKKIALSQKKFMFSKNTFLSRNTLSKEVLEWNLNLQIHLHKTFFSLELLHKSTVFLRIVSSLE